MKLSDAHRMEVVKAFRLSGLTQVEFCRQNSGLVSPRALRAWIRLADAKNPSDRVGRVLERALIEIEKLCASFAPAPSATPPALPRCDETTPQERSVDAEVPARPPASPAQEGFPAPEPVRTPFDWSLD